MIRLTKLSLSPELRGRLAEHTRRFEDALASGETPSKTLLSAYNDPAVKDLLKSETRGKCAYCESKILHIDYGDIEHIIPKDVRPGLRYCYENLTLACGVCNTNKAKHLDVLNPYENDPSDHLFAAGNFIFRRPGSILGHTTELRLRLNRPELVEKRAERLNSLVEMADQIAKTSNAAYRDLLIDEFLEQCSDETEYAMVARAYAQLVMNDLREEQVAVAGSAATQV